MVMVDTGEAAIGMVTVMDNGMDMETVMPMVIGTDITMELMEITIITVMTLMYPTVTEVEKVMMILLQI